MSIGLKSLGKIKSKELGGGQQHTLTQMIIILLATCLRNKSWVQTFYSFRRCFVTIAGPSTSRSTFQAFFLSVFLFPQKEK